MPIYRQINHGLLVIEAEQLAAREIDRQFNQDVALTAISVAVIGTRNGEVIPVLAVNVTRSDWLNQPQIGTWARYYGESDVLWQRHQDRIAIATLPSNSVASVNNRLSQRAIDQAYDEGRLPPDLVQRYYLTDLD
jgi:hypothetical protein